MADELLSKLLELRNASQLCDSLTLDAVRCYDNPPLEIYKSREWERRSPGPKAELRDWHPEGLREWIKRLDAAIRRWDVAASNGVLEIVLSMVGMRARPVYVNGQSYPLAHDGARSACEAVRDILNCENGSHDTAIDTAKAIAEEISPLRTHSDLYGQIEAEFWEAVRQIPDDDGEPNQPPAATANDARDKWIYDKAMKGTCWDTIAVDLEKKPKSWKRISGPGCKRAAIRFAGKNSLPSPPTRKQGRPKNTAKK